MAIEKEAAVKRLRELEAKQAALTHAGGLLYCDGVTVAPEDSVDGRARTTGILSGMEYELASSPETQQLLDELEEHIDELDEQARREVKVLRRETGKIIKIRRHSATPKYRFWSTPKRGAGGSSPLVGAKRARKSTVFLLFSSKKFKCHFPPFMPLAI